MKKVRPHLEYVEREDGLFVFMRFDGCDVALGLIGRDRYPDVKMVKDVIDAARESTCLKGGASNAANEVPLPRLLLWKKDLCSMLGVKIRTLDRMISSGEVPRPDRQLRGHRVWLARTIHEWAESGCRGTTENLTHPQREAPCPKGP